MLLKALGGHDRLTRGHSERVRAYTEVIAEEMGLPPADREKLRWAALVHDVGKLAVAPSLLAKDGRPTDAEWEEIRGHPDAGARMLAPLEPWLGEWLGAGPSTTSGTTARATHGGSAAIASPWPGGSSRSPTRTTA